MAVLTSERLTLRPFTQRDVPAILALFSDPVVNTFLPWYPLKTEAEAQTFYQERLRGPYCWAICLQDRLRGTDVPRGYIKVKVSPQAPYDLGYALGQDYWHQGLATEAGTAILAYVQQAGLPYVTATHDRHNPRSGQVLQRLGMQYCYSYREQWQPKNLSVVFRLYQLNFSAPEAFMYRGYWERYTEHWVEEL